MRILLLLGALSAAAAADPDPQPPRPKVVTKSWLSEFAKGKWPIAKIVDPARGLIVIRHLVDSGSANHVPVTTAKRLCGKELDKQAPALEREIDGVLKISDVVECSNRPGPPQCRFQLANEWSTAITLQFHAGDSELLTLDTVLVLDGGSMTDKSRDAQDVFVQSKLAALAKTDCTKTK